MAFSGATLQQNFNMIPLTLTTVREEGLGFRIFAHGLIALDILLPRSVGDDAALQAGLQILGLVRPEHLHLFRVQKSGEGNLANTPSAQPE